MPRIYLMMLISTLFLFSLPSQAKAFEEDLQKFILAEPSLNGAIIGVSVRSAETGKILFEFNGNTRLRPASNLKLLTAASALAVLGEDYSFVTNVVSDGSLQGSTLAGDLYLVGKGDPSLQLVDFDHLASQIKKSGINKIEGDLIGDDSWYDDVRLSPDMIWSDEQHYYGSQISALMAAPNQDFDTGSLIVEVKPGRTVGERARISVFPNTDFVQIDNQATTVTPDGQSQLEFERLHGTNTIVVKGIVPLKFPGQKEYIAVWDPTGFALALFNQALKGNGITVTGKIRYEHSPGGKTLATHKSIPLSNLLVPFMKLSNNVHAEILVKEIGKVRNGEGSWKKGLEIMNEQLGELGINTKSLVIRDGSGISHINLVTTNVLTQLLFRIQKESWFDCFYQSLPVAGGKGKLESGTLHHRMASLDLKAKTGTLTTVTSLSGYLQTNSGEELIFSILINNLLDEDKGKLVEDRIVEILAND